LTNADPYNRKPDQTEPMFKLMHAAADSCMSPDQRKHFDAMGDNDRDVYARLFRSIMKQANLSMGWKP
jgi:hypothetical protein